MEHSYVIAPLKYKDHYPYMKGITVCINCGCWEETQGFDTCEDFLKGIGGSNNHYLDALLRWLPDMPVRVPVPNEFNTGFGDLLGPKEDIPGLTPETIDRDAYDDFMRNL